MITERIWLEIWEIEDGMVEMLKVGSMMKDKLEGKICSGICSI